MRFGHPCATTKRSSERFSRRCYVFGENTPQPYLISIATINLGYSALLSDELDTAQALIEEGHANAQEIDCRLLLAQVSGVLAGNRGGTR